jgi:hypothetical protein
MFKAARSVGFVPWSGLKPVGVQSFIPIAIASVTTIKINDEEWGES